MVFLQKFLSGKLPILVNNTGILPVSGLLLVLVTVANPKMYYFHELPNAEVILFR